MCLARIGSDGNHRHLTLRRCRARPQQGRCRPSRNGCRDAVLVSSTRSAIAICRAGSGKRNGYRSFGPQAVRRAHLVVSLRKLGLSHDNVRAILTANDGRSLRQRLLGRLDEQIADRDLRIAVLQGEREDLRVGFDALICTPRDRAGHCICGAMLAACDCSHATANASDHQPLDLALGASRQGGPRHPFATRSHMAHDGSSTETRAYRPAFTLDDGPITEVHAFWLAGMRCDGCTISASGAQNPSVEQLLNARLPGLPRVILHHPVLSVTAGKDFMKAHPAARNGTLGAPQVVLYEGSVADERISGATGGYFSGMCLRVGPRSMAARRSAKGSSAGSTSS